MSKLNNWFIDINEYKYNKLDNNEYRDIHYYHYKNGFGFGRGVDCGHGDLNGEGDEEIYNNGYLTGKGYGRGSGNGYGFGVGDGGGYSSNYTESYNEDNEFDDVYGEEELTYE